MARKVVTFADDPLRDLLTRVASTDDVQFLNRAESLSNDILEAINRRRQAVQRPQFYTLKVFNGRVLELWKKIASLQAGTNGGFIYVWRTPASLQGIPLEFIDELRKACGIHLATVINLWHDVFVRLGTTKDESVALTEQMVCDEAAAYAQQHMPAYVNEGVVDAYCQTVDIIFRWAE